jgi:hypothetical protein
LACPRTIDGRGITPTSSAFTQAHGVAQQRRAFIWGMSSQFGAFLVHLLPLRRRLPLQPLDCVQDPGIGAGHVALVRGLEDGVVDVSDYDSKRGRPPSGRQSWPLEHHLGRAYRIAYEHWFDQLYD